MNYTILDCYTDEASGLGVPPYLGTYPRYLYGKLVSEGHNVKYLTIDDLRLWKQLGGVKKEPKPHEKTNIFVYNLTRNNAKETINKTEVLIVILGVHVPGKYLTAVPGTLKEVVALIKDLNIKKVLTGPAVLGTQLEGGQFFEKEDLSLFNEVKDYKFTFTELEKLSEKSADILDQIPDRRVIEIETGRGCKVGKCSFCTEPLKSRFANRNKDSVVKEVVAYYKKGARNFRLGKQADFYASDNPIEMLKEIRKKCPEIEILHIDNVNPNSVVAKGGEEITKAIVEYCTAGNIAAFGVESFDSEVVKANLLNTSPMIAMKAVEIINKYGAERGENGMPKFLPGINIIFGLLNETKETHQKNMQALQQIMDKGLMLRRINVRQVAILPGTYLETHGGNKFWKKNKKYYWKWRNEIRQKIDFPMLERVVPVGSILNDVWTEMYDGKTTFCRQLGTYPLIIGVEERIPLGKKISIKVKKHMLRSIVGEVVK
ncbi:radical SAM protein [Candidatus Woesearchaeota archaeon CG_4_10_14_0_2_um_filter_33_13]|nr:MAG: radical SAM protein [Candidatus Woesearchaeota archaeon CG_4_10_14_0_2_um_filter_33_13]